MLPLVLSLMLIQGGPPRVIETPPFPVYFEGNTVLPTQVYEAILELPRDAKPTLAVAQDVAAQVERFLLRSGYELARVDVSVSPTSILVHIDEGKLERLVFRGRVTLQMLRFRLALDLPKNVFNRPHLERELADRARSLGLDVPHWELVRTRAPEHEGLQLDPSPALVVAGRQIIRAQQPWELHFTFGRREWSTGLGLEFRTSWLNGVELGLTYQGASTFLHGDRWKVAVSGGLGLRRDLPRSNIYVTPTRARAEAYWLTPALDPRERTRGLVELNGEYFLRQRRDFGLENYSAARTEVALGLATRLHSVLTARVTAGVHYFRVMELTVGEGGEPPPGLLLSAEADPWRLWAFGEARAEFTFFDGGARADHRHALLLSARVQANVYHPGQPLFFDARLAYQLVVPIGWHELWFNAKGVWLSGDVPFPFEEVMGQHLPAVFGDVWMRKVFGVSVGFRYSLLRDEIKVGLFAKGLSYGEEQRDLGTAVARAGVGAGPSVHLLVLDLFQVDLFLNVAVLSNGRVGAGVLLWLNKVF